MRRKYKVSLLFLLFNLFFIYNKSFAIDRYWRGTTSSSWNDINNWSATSGGATGVTVPIGGYLVYFDGNGNNPCSINANAPTTGALGAVSIAAGYTNTISFSGTQTFKCSSFNQAGGTFTASNNALTMSGAVTLSGGTFNGGSGTINFNNTVTLSGCTFTSTSGTLNLQGTSFSFTSGTFSHGSGTIISKPGSGSYDFGGSAAPTFYNLTLFPSFSGTSAYNISNTAGINVANILSLEDNSTPDGEIVITATSSTYELMCQGNITITNTIAEGTVGSAVININGTGAQTLTGSGTALAGVLPSIKVTKSAGALSLASKISIDGNWTYAVTGTGSVSPGTSEVIFYDLLASGTYTIDGEDAGGTAMSFNDLTLGDATPNTVAETLAGKLKIAGTLTVNNGSSLNVASKTCTLTSTATTTSRLAALGTGTITNATTMAYERYIPGTVAGWIGLGNPATSGTFQQIRSKIKIACPTCDDGDALGFYSIQYYAEASSGWAHGAKLDDDNITNGKGYFVWCDDGLDNTITTTSPVTLTLTGSPKTGTTDLAPTLAGDGWNLLANPYPSPISWNALEFGAGNRANISDTKYVYDADQNGGAGDYIADVANGSSVTTEGGTDVIPPFQAFFVLVSTTAPTLNCTEAMKVSATTSSNPTYLKTDEILNSLKLILHAPAHSRFTAYTTATEIQFASDASKYFNLNEDAMRLEPGNGSSIIFTSLNDTNYAINKLPELTNDVSIPVMVRGFTAEHSISISDYTGIPEGSTIILEDLFTKTKTNLRTGDYSFSFSDTTSIPRFLLHISASVTGINTHNPDEKSVNIGRNDNGVFVQFNFDQTENATISAFNALGQKVMEDMNIEALNQKIALNLDIKISVSFIKVQTGSKVITKKIFN